MMKLRKIIALVLALALCGTTVAFAEEMVISAILNAGTTQAFAPDAVAEDDLTAILEAGLSATSAINQQPWYFAVVTDPEVMEQIGGGMGAPGGMPADMKMPEGMQMPEGAGAPGGMPEGMTPPAGGSTGAAKAALGDSPVAIIIYMDKGSVSPNPSFDCGLACQNMVIAANALGYGTKIISSPTNALNGENHDSLCEILGVDPSLEAVAVLLIGYEDGAVDATASASIRSKIDEKVSFVK